MLDALMRFIQRVVAWATRSGTVVLAPVPAPSLVLASGVLEVTVPTAPAPDIKADLYVVPPAIIMPHEPTIPQPVIVHVEPQLIPVAAKPTTAVRVAPATWPMLLDLERLPSDRVHGAYKVDGKPGRMPESALELHPLAAASFLRDLADVIVVSDIRRTPESSLLAVQTKRGAQPPGYSGHGFGFCIDLNDVQESMAAVGAKKKADLDAWMAERGWLCHRRDGKLDSECWHFNYLRIFESLTGHPLAFSPKATTTAGDLEALIQALYSPALSPDDRTCQRLLAMLKFYGGAIDGDIGPRSVAAIQAFQRAWGCPTTGKLDVRTRRTLAFVTAILPS